MWLMQNNRANYKKIKMIYLRSYVTVSLQVDINNTSYLSLHIMKERLHTM